MPAVDDRFGKIGLVPDAYDRLERLTAWAS